MQAQGLQGRGDQPSRPPRDPGQGARQALSEIKEAVNCQVITVREKSYPFKARWECACGHVLKSTVMGPGLYVEFAEHVWEVKDGQHSERS